MRDFDTRSEIQAFLQFALGVWPRHSARADELPRRCSRCILSEASSRLYDGLCEVCLGELKRGWKAGYWGRFEALELELDDLLKGYQGAGDELHDAVVLCDGGKHGAFVLDELRRRHPCLRILAVMVDNGFLNPVAVGNALRAVELLELDFLLCTPRPALFRKTFRWAFSHLERQSCFELVNRFDWALSCELGCNLAATFKAPSVVVAASRWQCEKVLGLTHFELPLESSRGESTPASLGIEALYSDEEQALWWDDARWPRERRPRLVFPLQAWPVQESTIQRQVVERGLVEASREHPLASGSFLLPLMLTTDIRRLGYSGFEQELAELVREDGDQRQSWLNVVQAAEHLAQQGCFLPRTVAEALRRLALSATDLGLPLMDEPVRTTA
jgi:hypothetical protein